MMDGLDGPVSKWTMSQGPKRVKNLNSNTRDLRPIQTPHLASSFNLRDCSQVMASANVHAVPSEMQDDHDWRVDEFESLDAEQQQVYRAALNGENVLIAGHAMSGKSNLLRVIELGLLGKHGGDVYVVAAKTSLAFFPGWYPVNTFFGISNYDLPIEDQVREAQDDAMVVERWTRLKALVLDDGERPARQLAEKTLLMCGSGLLLSTGLGQS